MTYQSRIHLRKNENRKRQYKTFVEDPNKAVFLSGFRNNILYSEWKNYRETIYQDIQNYGIYIVKLDLPVNSKYGYLHCGTIEQAEYLLNLNNDRDNENGKQLSVLKLANHRVNVYEYKKTEKRIIDEKHRSTNHKLNLKIPNYNQNPLIDTSRSESPFNCNTDGTSIQNSSRSSFCDNNVAPAAPHPTPFISMETSNYDLTIAGQLNNINQNQNKQLNNDSAFTLSEQVSDDEFDVEQKYKQKSTDSNNSNKTIDEVVMQASDQYIHEELSKCWRSEFNNLDDNNQILLMYLFIQQCHLNGIDAAKNILNTIYQGSYIQGCNFSQQNQQIDILS